MISKKNMKIGSYLKMMIKKMWNNFYRILKNIRVNNYKKMKY